MKKMGISAFIRNRAGNSEHTEAELRRLYALEGLARRIFSQSDSENLVVRGILATSIWLRPFHRPVQDIDLMAERHDPAEWGKDFVLRGLKAEYEDDGVEIVQAGIEAEVSWADTELPGMRFQVPVRLGGKLEIVQIDLAAWDTLALPAVWMDYPGMRPNTDFSVHTVVPEQACAWKMHGLFEFWDTSGTWRIKDLYDSVMIFRSVKVDQNLLLMALKQAFLDRATPAEVCGRFLQGNFGTSGGSRKHWKQFVKSMDMELHIQSLGELREEAHRLMNPIFEALLNNKGPENGHSKA